MASNGTTQKTVMWRLRPAERKVLLLIGDAIVSAAALILALYFWAAKDDWLDLTWQFLQERPPFWFYLLPFLWLLLLVELYDNRRSSRRSETFKGVSIAALFNLGIYLLIYFSSEPNSLPRRGVAAFIVLSAIFTLLWRLFYIRVFTAPQFMRRVLIVGAGRAGTALAEIVHGFYPPPFFMVGLIDDDPQKIGVQIGGYPVLGSSKELLDIVMDQCVTDVVCAISHEMNPELFKSLISLEEQGIEVTTMPVVYEELMGRVPIALLQSDWIIRSFFDEAHTSGFYEVGKRLLDIVGATAGCVALVMMWPFVALMILLDSGFPILYRQERLGKNGRAYYIIKFRTMRQDAEKDGKARLAVENDERVTRIGKFLRRSHIDEFPQFINVLRGEMSLVGPRAERPQLVNELQTLIPFYRARLLVNPGLTGWAQVNYGYASTVEDSAIKLEFDLYYIKRRNLLLDFSIILRTSGTVFGFKGQ